MRMVDRQVLHYMWNSYVMRSAPQEHIRECKVAGVGNCGWPLDSGGFAPSRMVMRVDAGVDVVPSVIACSIGGCARRS
jgi:hypothetical protein